MPLSTLPEGMRVRRFNSRMPILRSSEPGAMALTPFSMSASSSSSLLPSSFERWFAEGRGEGCWENCFCIGERASEEMSGREVRSWKRVMAAWRRLVLSCAERNAVWYLSNVHEDANKRAPNLS
jgi:hypothetical protein